MSSDGAARETRWTREPLLEAFLRRRRIARVLPYLRRYPQCRLLDIGCGRDAALLRAVEPWIASGVGIDAKAPALHTAKLRTRVAALTDRLPFDDAAFDCVTLLAVLEHLDFAEAMVNEIGRVLRPGGGLVMTVPSHAAKPVLELLAFRLGFVSAAEIRDHKRYYGRADLKRLIDGSGSLRVVTHRYFQLGFNNLVFARRLGRDGA